MSRTQRLFDLLQALRRRRRPVAGVVLANELGVSLRTLYRYIAALQSLGAEIKGDAGVGYMLRPGFLLPPLMFSLEEAEAVQLGVRWVSDKGDHALARAARNAYAKIAAVLPAELRYDLDEPSLLLASGPEHAATAVDIAVLRSAIQHENKLSIVYRDLKSELTNRTIWPFALGYFDKVRMLAAWCELRDDYRHFRADRIVSAEILDMRYPRRRQELVREWRERFGIAPQ
jgi:predicted DNA-binding transcriptional regulator YafY